MSSIETTFVYLLSNAWAAGLVGALIGDRVYPDEKPKGVVYPCAVYTLDVGRRDYTHDGPSGLVQHYASVDLYAATAGQLATLRNAFVADWRNGGLSGFKGAIPDLSGVSPESPPYVIYGLFVDNEADSVEVGLEGPGPRTKFKSFDLRIWAKDS